VIQNENKGISKSINYLFLRFYILETTIVILLTCTATPVIIIVRIGMDDL